MKLLRLKEIIKEKNTTSKALAERLNKTPATISNIANGKHFPNQDLLIGISGALGVGVRDLFMEEEGNEPIYIKKGSAYVKIGEIKPL